MSFPKIDTFTGTAAQLPDPPWKQVALSTGRVNRDGSGNAILSIIDTADGNVYRDDVTAFPNDQYVIITIGGNLVASANYVAGHIRCSGTGAGFKSYSIYSDGALGLGHTGLYKANGSGGNDLVSLGITAAAGDRLMLIVRGNVLYAYRALAASPTNFTFLLSYTDDGSIGGSAYSAGSAGFGLTRNNTPGPTIADFECGGAIVKRRSSVSISRGGASGTLTVSCDLIAGETGVLTYSQDYTAAAGHTISSITGGGTWTLLHEYLLTTTGGVKRHVQIWWTGAGGASATSNVVLAFSGTSPLVEAASVTPWLGILGVNIANNTTATGTNNDALIGLATSDYSMMIGVLANGDSTNPFNAPVTGISDATWAPGAGSDEYGMLLHIGSEATSELISLEATAPASGDWWAIAVEFVPTVVGGGGGTYDRWQLESGTGYWQSESGVGYWNLESSNLTPPPTGYTIVADVGSFVMTGKAAGLYLGRKVGAGTGVFSMNGQAANLRKSYPLIANVGVFSLTGQLVNLRAARRVPILAGSFSLNGQAAGLSKGQRLTASPGSFVLTGRVANLLRGYRVPANTGSFSLLGQALRLLRTVRFIAAPGSFVLTGIATRGLYGYRLPSNTGVFTFTGQPAGLLLGRRVLAAKGTFVLTPVATTILRYGRYITAAKGTFVMTGIANRLLHGSRMPANTGVFTLNGQAANLVKGVFYNMPANVGVFVLSGQAALFKRTYRMIASPGAFSLVGKAAGSIRTYKLVASPAAFVLTGKPAGGNRGYRGVSASGSFILTGKAARLLYGRVLKAGTGVFLLNGLPEGFLHHYRLHANSGAFVLTGQDANLVYFVPSSAVLDGDVVVYQMLDGDGVVTQFLDGEASVYQEFSGDAVTQDNEGLVEAGPMLTGEVTTLPGL